MPKLRSIGWSLLALAFLIAVGMFILFVGMTFIEVNVLNPQLIVDLFIWPITRNVINNFFGNIIITFAWLSFIAGLGFLGLHYSIKLLYQ